MKSRSSRPDVVALPDGEGPDRNSPLRTCIVTRQQLPADSMIRFVASPDGVVTPDIRRKLPGRGVWVTATRTAVAEAVRRKAFARGLKAEARPPDDLVTLVGDLLRRDALSALALANKAGAVVTGAAKVEGGAARRYVALIHATDASAQGVEKLERLVRSQRRDGPAIPSIRTFGSGELSLSLGREHVIHAALVAGRPANFVIGRVLAADRYQRTEPAATTSPGDEPGGDVETRIEAEE